MIITNSNIILVSANTTDKIHVVIAMNLVMKTRVKSIKGKHSMIKVNVDEEMTTHQVLANCMDVRDFGAVS